MLVTRSPIKLLEVTAKLAPNKNLVMQKALLVTNIPTPYRVPLFNVVHDELSKKDIHFKVIFAVLGYS